MSDLFADNIHRCTYLFSVHSGDFVCTCVPEEQSVMSLVTRRCVLDSGGHEMCVIEMPDGSQREVKTPK